MNMTFALIRAAAVVVFALLVAGILFFAVTACSFQQAVLASLSGAPWSMPYQSGEDPWAVAWGGAWRQASNPTRGDADPPQLAGHSEWMGVCGWHGPNAKAKPTS